MKALSAHEAAVTLVHGQDPKTIGITRLNNVQNYHFQQDPGIGHENKLNIGLAATYYEIELDGTDVSVFDLEKKDEVIKKGLQKTLTVNALQDLIDSTHLAKVCALQCINALAQNIPHLAYLKAAVSSAYTNDVAKQRLPVKASKIHPLASSGRNKMIIIELKDTLVDFLGQTGQSKDSFKPRLFPVGGNGLTYEKMIQLSEYLQFHPNDFEAMCMLQPILEWWHTEWTNLS